MVPVAGSAYTYTFATLGQLVAFIIGWDLVLEFTIGASAVAVGFAGYLNALLDQVFGVTLPDAITAPPGDGGTVNVFAHRDRPVRRPAAHPRDRHDGEGDDHLRRRSRSPSCCSCSPSA